MNALPILRVPRLQGKGEGKRRGLQAADVDTGNIPHPIQTLKPACSGTNIRALGWVRGSAYRQHRESLKKEK